MGIRLFECLSEIKGKLPHLQDLQLRIWGTQKSKLDFFEDAPRLVAVNYSGAVSLVPGLPWGTLRSFTYNGGDKDLGAVFALMSRCAPTTVFQLRRLDLSRQSDALDIAPTTASTASLILSIGVPSSPERASDILGEILDSLTLPALCYLRLRPTFDARPLHWPTPAFLAFLTRSACTTSLTFLELDAVISLDALVRCLSTLPALKTLFLADPRSTHSPNLTDALFRCLALVPDGDQASFLVPRLGCLRCTTRMRFKEAIFLAFVRSRAEVRRHGRTRPFEVEVSWFGGAQRGFGAGTRTALMEMVREGEVVLAITPYTAAPV
ncbi:hypothetical protein C8F04DRAFT_1393891 [Mycena alexandri]|uniref:Uncharacterized protein n=1 Tax=Mycena alexandri TaxID=1745969 RepID=A0AAD6T136_9AGAR|nr:hypothetical protein C8F04DRAFT_1393891 [Mycena alexandri]